MIAPRAELRFSAEDVRLGASAESWRDAVEQVGRVLVERGYVLPGYSTRMIRVIEKHGPYMVIAPGIALVHARPDAQTLENALAVVTFPEGVAFGHGAFDPVEIVIGASTTRPDDHLAVVAGIARALDTPGLIERLMAAQTPEALAAALTEQLSGALDLRP